MKFLSSHVANKRAQKEREKNDYREISEIRLVIINPIEAFF
jgi:hypothetical protein